MVCLGLVSPLDGWYVWAWSYPLGWVVCLGLVLPFGWVVGLGLVLPFGWVVGLGLLFGLFPARFIAVPPVKDLKQVWRALQAENLQCESLTLFPSLSLLKPLAERLR